MKDLYLRFENEAQAQQALLQFGFQQSEDGHLYMHDVCLDVIGMIYTPDNPDAEEPVYTPVSGWHVNLRIVDDSIASDELRLYAVGPGTPVRVWA